MVWRTRPMNPIPLSKIRSAIFMIAILVWSGCAKPAPPVGNGATAPDTDAPVVLDPLSEGDAFSQQGDTEMAIRHYTGAIRANPARAEAYARRGDAYAQQGALQPALADYNEALRLKPQSTEVYLTRANVHQAAGRLEEALADANEALRRDPGFPAAYSYRATVYIQWKQYDKAIFDCDAALRLKADFA